MVVLSLALAFAAPVADSIDIAVDQPTAKVDRSLFGAFFEEINNAGEGGLYAELLFNRAMVRGADGAPAGWSLSAGATFDPSTKLSGGSPGALRVPAGASATNGGFWGIPAKANQRLSLRVWVRGSGRGSATLADEKGVLSTALFSSSRDWREHALSLTPSRSSATAKLTLRSDSGELTVGYSSLMPAAAWKGRKNGLRSDLAERVNAMRPGFMRFPGGCYVEGNDLSNSFDWRGTLRPIQNRTATPRIFWGYISSNGLGYHEYLEFCEDLKAEPMFVANCGMSHSEITPMAQMSRHVQDALDAIEYANGPIESPMGKLRAANGHPKPFNLKYLEIGNENGYGWSFGGPAPYYERFKLINEAVKAKYPGIITISNVVVPNPGDLTSEHYYDNPAWFWRNKDRYDAYDRKGPKIYVGEYAVTRANGRGSLAGALSEAAFMTGMERNADVVKMASYAPLFENIHNRQWNPNAIVFDSTRSYGTPSYWVQTLFAENRVDVALKAQATASIGEPPPIEGRFGFKTWRTAAEFRNVRLVIDGVERYRSDSPKLADFDGLRGEWSEVGGALRQAHQGDDRVAALKGIEAKASSNWSFEFEGKALEGYEGFMAMAGFKSAGETLQWNLGGWGNTEHAFQRNGERVGRPVRGKIEHGRWVKVKIEKVGSRVVGSLDGVQIEELKEVGAPDLAVGAGYDFGKGELVVKIVNGGAGRTVSIAGVPDGRYPAKMLKGRSLSDENTLDQPENVAPSTASVSVTSGRVSVEPYSLTILRVKANPKALAAAKAWAKSSR